MTPSDWLYDNIADLIVAISRAHATLAGSTTKATETQVDPRLSTGSDNA